MIGDGSPPPSFDRDQCIAEIIAGCSDRVNQGELVDMGRIVAEHPDLAPELGIALDALLSLETTAGDPVALIGRRLGDFRILRGIGRGGMGVVYEARQESLDRHVALKVLPTALLGRDTAVRRFVREARVAARLQHPNVVTTFGMGIESDIPYFAMELVDGETLEQILRRPGDSGKLAGDRARNALDTDEIQLETCLEVARLFAGAAEGLHHAHARGVIHRDIKPSNLILDRNGRLRILDFGLARLEGEDHLTISGDLVGTPLYMSPEQAARTRIEVGAPSDIYSMGATLYQMLTRQAPFSGEDVRETIDHIIHQEPVPPRRIQPRIPAALETVVLKCMMKKPRDRYLTADALAQDLMRVVRGDAIEARPRSTVQRCLTRLSRHRVKLSVGGVFVVLLISVALLVLSNRNQDRLRRLAQYGPLLETAARQMQFRHQATALHDVGDIGIDMQAFFGGLSSLLEFVGTDQRELARRAVEDLTLACELVPERPEGFYHRAKAWLILGRIPEAERDLDRAEKNDPSFVPAVMLRATMREMEGDAEGARRLHREAEARATSEWSRSWVRAQIGAGDRAWAAASDAFGRLIDLEDSHEAAPYLGFSVDSRLGRGIARLNLEDFEGAIDDFVYARAHWPDAVEPALLLGRAYLFAGDTRHADRVFSRVYEEATARDDVANWVAVTYFDRDDEVTALSWMDRVDDEPLRLKGRAFILISLERYEEAILACERCIELLPQSSIGWMLKGLALYRRDRLLHPERLALALEMEEKAYGVDPDSSTARCGYGVALVESGRLDDGISMLESSLALTPDNLVAHYYIGKALEQRGELEAAAGSLLAALSLAPGFEDASARLAGIRFRQGQVAEARALVSRVLEAQPDHLLGRITQASLLAHDGEYARAAEILGSVAEAWPDNREVREQWAVALAESGDREGAIRQVRRLARIDESRADYQTALAELYSANGDTGHAIAAYGRAITIDGNVAAYHRRLGEILLGAGETQEARQAFRRSLQLDPDQPDLHRQLDDLESGS